MAPPVVSITAPASGLTGASLGGEVVVTADQDFTFTTIKITLVGNEFINLDGGHTTAEIADTTLLLSGPGPLNLHAGRHVFPFSLPTTNLPGSLSNQANLLGDSTGVVEIAYKLKAVMTGFEGGVIVKEHAVELFEVPSGPLVSASGSDRTTFYLVSGHLEMSAQTPGRVAQGARVVVNVSFDNTSSKKLTSFSVNLFRDVTARITTPELRTKQHSLKIASMSYPPPPESNQGSFDLSFPLPPNLVPSVHHGENFQLVYRLVVSCEVRLGTGISIVLPLDILHAQVAQKVPGSAAGAPAGSSSSSASGAGAGAGSGAGAAQQQQHLGAHDAVEGLSEVPPAGVIALPVDRVLEHEVYFQRYIMFYIDIYGVGSGGRLVLDVDGIGRSAVIVLCARGFQPGMLTGSEASAVDLQNYKYTLMLNENTTPPLTPGRYFFGIWGNQFLPKPVSKFRIHLRLTNCNNRVSDRSKQASAGDAAGAAENAAATTAGATPGTPKGAVHNYDLSQTMDEVMDRHGFCNTCGHVGAEFECARCHEVSYCSMTCQKSHWAIHKTVCIPRPEDTDTIRLMEWDARLTLDWIELIGLDRAKFETFGLTGETIASMDEADLQGLDLSPEEQAHFQRCLARLQQVYRRLIENNDSLIAEQSRIEEAAALADEQQSEPQPESAQDEGAESHSAVLQMDEAHNDTPSAADNAAAPATESTEPAADATAHAETEESNATAAAAAADTAATATTDADASKPATGVQFPLDLSADSQSTSFVGWDAWRGDSDDDEDMENIARKTFGVDLNDDAAAGSSHHNDVSLTAVEDEKED